MGKEEMEKNISCVVREGLEGVTLREHRPNKALSLEQGVQARYFSKMRNDMNSVASSRIMIIGVNKSANELFKEISLG